VHAIHGRRRLDAAREEDPDFLHGMRNALLAGCCCWMLVFALL
jgi:hypothetical protein